MAAKLPDHRDLVGVLLHQADYFAAKQGNAALAQYGVSMYQAMSLIYIAANEDNRSVNQRAIERYTRLSNPGVSKLIGSLAEKGYIERHRDADDARNRSLHTTEKGREMAAVFHAVIAGSDDGICARLSPEERDELIRILKKIHI